MAASALFCRRPGEFIAGGQPADVSLAMYLSVIVASALWIFDAYVRGSVQLFVTNVVIAAIAIVITILKRRYGGG